VDRVKRCLEEVADRAVVDKPRSAGIAVGTVGDFHCGMRGCSPQNLERG